MGKIVLYLLVFLLGALFGSRVTLLLQGRKRLRSEAARAPARPVRRGRLREDDLN